MGVFLFAPLLMGPGAVKTKSPILGFASLTLAGAAGLYGWLGQPALTTASAQEHLKAQHYYADRQVGASKTAYEGLLEIFPDDSGLKAEFEKSQTDLRDLARFYYLEGQLRQSVETYEALIENYPEDTALKSEYDSMLADLATIPREQLRKIQTVGDLKQTLRESRSRNPSEWRQLGDLQMQLGDYNGALISYQEMVASAPIDPTYADILARAETFVETRKQANEMTPEEQQAMFENMVSGLAARLYESGGTEAEWSRLIRSRRALGQSQALAQDMEKLKQVFADQPDVITRILKP